MQVIRSIGALQEFVKSVNKTIGFVPTMGALHKGHASLINKSVEQNECTIVSTFVNPTQFLPGEDFDKYPKNELGDIKICEMCRADAIFIPDAKEMYLDDEPKILAPERLSSKLEGALRPGHFDGVLRIINKFFNIIRPNRAYFGKKDTQQLAIIQNMTKTFFMGIEIVPCEIIREADGLALSSRNSYLDEEEKMLALKLSRALLKASNMVSNGNKNCEDIKKAMAEILEPLKVDYIAFVDRKFDDISIIKPNESIILIAAYVGKTRLIDNIWL